MRVHVVKESLHRAVPGILLQNKSAHPSRTSAKPAVPPCLTPRNYRTSTLQSAITLPALLRRRHVSATRLHRPFTSPSEAHYSETASVRITPPRTLFPPSLCKSSAQDRPSVLLPLLRFRNIFLLFVMLAQKIWHVNCSFSPIRHLLNEVE